MLALQIFIHTNVYHVSINVTCIMDYKEFHFTLGQLDVYNEEIYIVNICLHLFFFSHFRQG